jgi:hypothetical protein
LKEQSPPLFALSVPIAQKWRGCRNQLALEIAAGVGLSLASTQLLRALLFSVQPRDPATLAIGATLMAASPSPPACSPLDERFESTP